MDIFHLCVKKIRSLRFGILNLRHSSGARKMQLYSSKTTFKQKKSYYCLIHLTYYLLTRIFSYEIKTYSMRLVRIHTTPDSFEQRLV